MTAGRRIELRGTVQGVGFRPWVYRLAIAHGVGGRVRNDASGVTIEAFGPPDALDRFASRLSSHAPPAARVDETRSFDIPVEAVSSFAIVGSVEGAAPRVSIPPDLATCPDCLIDIDDPRNRRFGYPFTNCTNCGPRFTIARDIPYDRARTTMAAFAMCRACRLEWENAGDRRFHAQPNACPDCGPSLMLSGPDGRAIADAAPIERVAAALAAGSIVAIKGLGGVHLACDATSVDAVARLRDRKRRDEKPFAVMVATPAEAAAVAMMSREEHDLLVSVERPIVLMQRRADGPLAGNVAPFSPFVGVMLPYTPLHHLLLARVRRPLVMTSGNISDEPIAADNADALANLGAIADWFLLHDRDIATACDDSVAMAIRGRPVVLRRSRGFVPAPIAVRPAFDAPVLACGALLKNTFCLAAAGDAWLGPHVGDLATGACYQRFADAIDAMQRFLRVRPEIIAYDLHPDYLSTRYALARPEPIKVGVQHHHAHVVSAMVEHDLREPVIGVAYDGTGYGLDGTAWGGEVLVARRAAFERVATLRPVLLAGGDMAIRQPWRVALALVLDAFGADAPLEALPLFRAIGGERVDFVRRMIAGEVNTPLAHGAGRYFDGIASLALARGDSSYEGQLALWWNGLAGADDRVYGFGIDRSTTPWTIDLRPMVRAIVGELVRGLPAEVLAARFHNTLVAATSAAVRLTADAHGAMPVVLSGGCFQNRRLAEGVAAELASRFEVHLHERVPPGDGGIALGQAAVAAAVAQGR